MRSTVLVCALVGAIACGSSGPTEPSGPPAVSDVNGASLPSGPTGSTVIIEGNNFGLAQGTVLFADGSGGTVVAVIANSVDWTNNFIVTTVPNGAATGSLVVQTSKGTSSPIVFTVSQGATFSPSAVAWASTSALPQGRSGLAAAYGRIQGTTTTPVVYAVGGSDNADAPVTTVYYATAGANGSLSSWTATASLPTAIAFHAAVVATPENSLVSAPGYLYVLGGAIDAAGTPTATVYRGTLSQSGAVSSWITTTSLPMPLHSLGATLFNGNLYIFGGSTTGNVPVATVYRARIDALGTLGAWQTLASLPYKRSYFGFGQFGGYLYAFGGDSGTVTPNDSVAPSPTAVNDVAYARIDLPSGNLTTAGWSANANKLKKPVSKHTAVIAGGNVLVTAGLYNGAKSGSTEESYAQLNTDGTTGSFNGATGSNTLNSVGGANLFSHAATGYTDASGAFHVLVLGGDDVNTPGTKHTGVFFY